MNRNAAVIVLIVLICIGIILVYNAPDENSRYENDLQGTITAGHRFSCILFIGNKHALLTEFDFTKEARAKLESAELQQVAAIEIIDKYEASGGKYRLGLSSMLFKEPEDIELVALERRAPFLAMTFKLKDSPVLPSKGQMLCSVVFRYYQPYDDIIWKKIFRKAANIIPFFNAFGTTGKWLIVDYGYTYNQSDYALWYLREGDAFQRQEQKESKRFLERLNSRKGRQEFREEIYKDLIILEMWASTWVKSHTEHLDEKQYQAEKLAGDK